MIRRIPYLLFILLFFSCGNKDPERMVEHLDGYWEIATVTMPDGTTKEYTISTVVDYIEVTGDTGIRKKVQPKLDGSFVVTQSNETFAVAIENEKLLLHYETPYDTWTETILDAEPDKLTVKNRDDKVYTYKRFTKFDFSK